MRKLAIFTGGFSAAAAVYVYWLRDVRILLLAALCVVLSLLCKFLSFKRLCILTLGIAIGVVWTFSYENIWMEEPLMLDDTQQNITVRVTQRPFLTRYGAAVECEHYGHGALLYGNKDLMKAQPGDQVSCHANVQVEEELYYRSSGTVYVLRGSDDIKIQHGEANVFEKTRMWIQDEINKQFHGETAGIVKALLTADRSGISYETTNSMSVTGISHTIAVSGMHVSILLSVVAMLCGYQPRLTALLGIPVITIFVMITGATPSVCRAAVMQSLLLCAPIAKRERDDITSLACAALLLLIQNPWCIANVSFQLSFAAVAGLVLFADRLNERLLALSKKPGKLARTLAGSISATIGATVLTIPLTMKYFDIVSVIAPLVNILVLWAITGIFVLGLMSCLIGSVVPAIPWIAECLCDYVLFVSKLGAKFPYAAAFGHNRPLMIWAAMQYILIATAVYWKKFPVRFAVCVSALIFTGCIGSNHYNFYREPWQFTALDVGQGQCLVLRNGDYITMIDCGGEDCEWAGEYAARYFHSAGITHIDAVIITHFDEDHFGGLEQFTNRIRVDRVYLPDIADDNEAYEKLSASGIEVNYVVSEINISIGEDLIRILPPVMPKDYANNGLCVLATAGECDILITGDLDETAERALIEACLLPDVEIFVAGHHGSRNSSSFDLLQTIRPEVTIVSAGEGNSYGHPSKETLERFSVMGTKVYRTDRQGDLTFYP